MTEKEIIDEVLQRLTDDFSDRLEVELFPDKPDIYVLQHPVGSIQVIGGASQSIQPNLRQQIDTRTIEIVLLFKSLNLPDGIYDTSEAVRTSLSGFGIENFPMYLMSETNPEFNIEKEWWQRSLVFVIPNIYLIGG